MGECAARYFATNLEHDRRRISNRRESTAYIMFAVLKVRTPVRA